MTLDGLRIGYAAYDPRLTPPGDRRRFVWYARRRGLEFSIADPAQSYDLVVVSAAADITRWARCGRSTRIVYDLIDSYLALPRFSPKQLGRGLVKFISRDTHHLALDFRRAIEAMASRADAVICSTEEQRRDLLNLCPNVHVILDAHTEDIRTTKSDYARGPVLNLVWEGLPQNLKAFNGLRGVLEDLMAEVPLTMHLITDLEFYEYAGRYRRRSTRRIADGLFPSHRLHPWSPDTFSTIASDCDLAVVPLDLDDPFAAGKPENKLVLLWRLGLPVLASATPAYGRAMARADLPMACATLEDWRRALFRYATDEQARREAGLRGRALAETVYGDDALEAAWDRVLASALEPGRS